MAFRSYLIDKFDYTHENKYFREFSQQLNQVFSKKDGQHILIGNLSCDGHMMDAVFIAPGSISVIDFKDYEGDLAIKENNPWRIKPPTGDFVFVKGGAQSRNPLQQVKAYRRSLAEFLTANSAEILDSNHEGVEWIHVGCIVLFQRNVNYNSNDIPSKMSRYFHVADTRNICNLLSDLYSSALALNDNEILRLLDVLGVEECNLLENHDFTSEAEEPAILSENKLHLIKQLLKQSEPKTNFGRILKYYHTLIDVERYNEPETREMGTFPFDSEQKPQEYIININSSRRFHEQYVRNFREEKWPKNVFVALNLFIEGRGIPLLHTIVMASDINGHDDLKVNLNELTIYQRPLENMGLAEDVIEELITETNERDLLGEKLELIRIKLGLDDELSFAVQVGLSTESQYTLQLAAELKVLSRKEKSLTIPGVFESFVFNKAITGSFSMLKLDPFVEIKELNNYQKDAVISSFSEPLTVVTGPPGSGKSQVVLSIIANAIVNGHSVVLASKNSRAVDVVKERLEDIINEPYILRLGSKDDIRKNTKPTLEMIIGRKSQGQVENKYHSLTDQRQQLIDDYRRKTELIQQINKLPSEIDTLKSEQEKLKLREEYLAVWKDNIDRDLLSLFVDRDIQVDVDKNTVGLLIQKLKNASSNFISKLIFNLFQKKSHIEATSALNRGLNKEIFDYVTNNEPYAQPDEDYMHSALANLNFLYQLPGLKMAIQLDHRLLIEQIVVQTEKVNNQRKYVQYLREQIPHYEKEIQAIDDRRKELSVKLLNLQIDQKLHDLDLVAARKYISYVPTDSGRWTEEETANFAEVSKRFLGEFNVVCITSLSVKNSFPLAPDLADILIIDEASQCDVASALPLLYRCKRAVIIGDRLQLRHITNVKKYESEYVSEILDLKDYQLDYVGNSLYDHAYGICNKSKIDSVFLAKHYRCHPQIAEFASRYIYEKQMGQTWEVQTINEQFKFGNPGINWISIEGGMLPDRNVNPAEVSKVVDLLRELTKANPNASIGVVTPFRHQVEEIRSKLDATLLEKVIVDTVYKYQGDEKDIIVFSTVVTKNAPEGKARFINRNVNQLNVAITRARSALYIVGNHDYCKKMRDNRAMTPLSDLATYVESLNRLS